MGFTKQVAVIVVLILMSAAVGRFTAPEKVRIETKTIEVEKKKEHDKEHKHVETTITEKPDGSKETKIVEDDRKDDRQSDTNTTVSDQTKEVTRSSGRLTLSALAGLRSIGDPLPVYGAGLNKQVLGPIGIGIWGFNSGSFGASVSLTF